MTDEALRDLQPRFNKLYAKTGRPSIATEKLLRALLLQALYSVRSERMLIEQYSPQNTRNGGMGRACGPVSRAGIGYGLRDDCSAKNFSLRYAAPTADR
jgi:hypothetical protein